MSLEKVAKVKGWEPLFEFMSKRDRDYMFTPVKEGHNELFRTCCILRNAGIEDIEQAAEVIAVRWHGYERAPQAREIIDAWEASEDAEMVEDGGEWSRAPRVKRDEHLIKGIVGNSKTSLESIKRASPIPYGRLEIASPAKIVRSLFPKNALICVGKIQSIAKTAHIDTICKSLPRMQFIVPSPMSSTKGKTKRGEWSVRCLDNTGPRLYAVTEFDFGTHDDQAKLINYLLPQYGDHLKMVLTSGGKSLHAWWKVSGDDNFTEKLYNDALLIGADPATRTLCQFVRTPNVVRDNGNKQQVLYFDNGN